MKKLVAIMLTLAMIAGLAACSGSQQAAEATTAAKAAEATTAAKAAETTAAAQTSGDKKIELEIWLPENDLENLTGYGFLVDCANRYTELHPNVTFKLTCITQAPGTYSERWKLGAATDTLPDLFPTTFGYLKEWSEAGVIVNMADEFANDQAFLDRFNPDAVECVSKFCESGSIYGIPFKAETFGWLYNVDLFEKYNLEIPETWDELLNCVKVFKEAGIIPIAQPGVDVWAVWGYHPFLTRYGFTYEQAQKIKNGELKYADCEGFTKAFARMDELAKMGAFNEDAYAIGHGQAEAMFENGQTAMYTTYSAIVPDMLTEDAKFHTAYNVGPEFSDGALAGKSGLRNYSWNIAVGKVAKSDPDRYKAVCDFLRFFASEEGTEILVKHQIPVAMKYNYDFSKMSRLEQDIYKSFSDDFISCDYAMSVWMPSNFVGNYCAVMTGILTQQITIDEALATLQEDCDNAR